MGQRLEGGQRARGCCVMVARIRPPQTGLTVTFTRDGEGPQRMTARDGAQAWQHAITMITHREALQHGDTLTVL